MEIRSGNIDVRLMGTAQIPSQQAILLATGVSADCIERDKQYELFSGAVYCMNAAEDAFARNEMRSVEKLLGCAVLSILYVAEIIGVDAIKAVKEQHVNQIQKTFRTKTKRLL